MNRIKLLKATPPDIIIGIDPDTNRSGVAFLDVNNKALKVNTLGFFDLIDYLKNEKVKNKALGKKLLVVVEASWNIKANWHLSQHERKQRAAAKGYDVGRNHEVGRLIVEFCKYAGMEVLEHFPLRKSWKGGDGKITHEELSYFTGIQGRTNQEQRDAALLAWHVANLPIKVKMHSHILQHGDL